MSDFIIINPRFIKTNTIRATLKHGAKQSKIELAVPLDEKRGVNKHFDYILDNFNLSEMKEQYKKDLDAIDKKRKNDIEKAKNGAEYQRLRALFDQKAIIFEMPFMKNVSSNMKAAIRRAPDMFLLNLIATEALKEYMASNNMSFNDYLDLLEEITYGNDNQ